MPKRRYGTWTSPFSAATATSAGLRFGDSIRIDGDDVYWVESRPEEGGRSAIVRRVAGGEISDIGPPDFNARSRVHEYGGAAFIARDGIVYAVRFEDQRIHRIVDGASTPITPDPPEPASLRYADPALGDGWMIVVRERHDGHEPVNELARVPLDGSTDPVVVASGHDFFAAPRISPDGTRIAWLTWDHPQMPWDGTDLWMAPLAGGEIGAAEHIAGGPAESVVQPEWSPDGLLHFASDRTGWWNLYRHEAAGAVPVHPTDAEHSQEMWGLGLARYTFLADGTIVVAEETPEGDRLLVLDEASRTVGISFDACGPSMASQGSTVVVVAHSFDRPAAIVRIDVLSGDEETLRAPAGPRIEPGLVATPQPIVFDTPDGPAHARYFPPAHPELVGPADEKPPLVVNVHGGPTARAGIGLEPERLFWTSRGFGVLDVDYGGSTGFGREYRERLAGQWGVVDVRDSALAAAEAARLGLADPDRMVIRGGSAGGLTVLLALAQYDVFAAGAARYPVTDLEMLARDTHKFESRYLDKLIGPLPDSRHIYQERSPLTLADSVTTPVLLMQGLEDRVVPPSQPEAMRDRLRAAGVPVGYLEFAGEGHGFRSAEARVRSLEAELSFFGTVLGIEPADPLAPVDLSAARSPDEDVEA